MASRTFDFGTDMRYALHAFNAARINNGANGWSILAGYDERGYAIRLQKCSDEAEPMVRAGCRYLTLKDARKHWVAAWRNRAASEQRTAAQVLMLIGLAVDTAKRKGLVSAKLRFNTTPRKVSKR